MTNKTKYEEWLGLRNFPWEYTDTDRRGFDLVLDSNDDKVNDHGSCWKEDAVLTAAAPDMLQLLVDIAQGAQLGVVDERIERVLRAAMPGDVVDEVLEREGETMSDSELDLDGLQQTALSATQGEWSVFRAGVDTGSGTFVHEHSEIGRQDSEHVAIFDPPTVLRMILAIRDAEFDAETYQTRLSNAAAHASSLEAKLAASEKRAEAWYRVHACGEAIGPETSDPDDFEELSETEQSEETETLKALYEKYEAAKEHAHSIDNRRCPECKGDGGYLGSEFGFVPCPYCDGTPWDEVLAEQEYQAGLDKEAGR